MRIVITGGCGFLGRRVALRLLERPDIDELVLFDNAPSALPLPEDRRLTPVTGDIADRLLSTVRGLWRQRRVVADGRWQRAAIDCKRAGEHHARIST